MPTQTETAIKQATFDLTTGRFIEGQEEGLSIIETVEVLSDNSAFADPTSFEKEPRIFEGNPRDVIQDGVYENAFMYRSLNTNAYYPYALASAILRQAKNILDQKNNVPKPERPVHQTDARVKKVLDEWKNKHTDDPNYFKDIKRLKPATSYYAGNAGKNMSAYSKLDGLNKTELASVIAAASTIVGGFKENAKSASESWFSTAHVHTPKGDKEYEGLKYQTLYNFNLIEKDNYTQKMEWVESFDFHEGWQYEGKEEDIEPTEISSLNKRAQDCILMFNYGFAINAINKDGLYLIIA